jgi:hypothetical protein
MGRTANGTYLPRELPGWISGWFVISTILVFWDCGYLLNRPRTFKGGDLEWLYKPYLIYERIDHIYSEAIFRNGHGFPAAQSWMNVVENMVNLMYLYSAHSGSTSLAAIAPFIGFTGATLTFWKTVVYWLQEYVCGWCNAKHVTMSDWLIFFVAPNSPWLIVPAVIMYVFGRQIVASLSVTGIPPVKQKAH